MQLDANADLTLKYKDEDGDLITLFDSADLAVAISYSRVLKLTLFINGEISVGQKPANIIANAHLIKELRGIRNRITEILDTLCDETNINGGSAPIGKQHVEAIDEAEVCKALVREANAKVALAEQEAEKGKKKRAQAE